jgi:hypothetical protein
MDQNLAHLAMGDDKTIKAQTMSEAVDVELENHESAHLSLAAHCYDSGWIAYRCMQNTDRCNRTNRTLLQKLKV